MNKWLVDVKIETGRQVDERGYTSTVTELVSLELEDGRIKTIQPASYQIPQGAELQSMKGQLLLPGFREMHNHLDKTYLSLDWKAIRPAVNLKHRLAMEAEELSDLAHTVKQRARAMIELLASQGATHIRTHVNIDPYIGLKNFEAIKQALEESAHKLTYEIVAFPQHGLLTPDVVELMHEAMQSGATHIGGLDPAGIDGRIEASLETMFSLAQQYDADIDIHLHDDGHVGGYTISKLIDYVRETGWQGRTAVSHAFGLGSVAPTMQRTLIEELAETKTSIMSTVPLTRSIPPIAELDAAGVGVHFGCDGFYDSWSSYGTGDLLEKSSKYSQVYRLAQEHQLAHHLKFITGGITPLDQEGSYQWPKVGDDATFVFVDAASSAEAVARVPKRQAIFFKGSQTYGHAGVLN